MLCQLAEYTQLSTGELPVGFFGIGVYGHFLYFGQFQLNFFHTNSNKIK